MLKYLKILAQSTKNAFSYMLMYRADFIIKAIVGVGWALVNLGIIQLIFLHTDSFNGWGRSDMVLLLLSFSLSLMVESTFGTYIDQLSDNIRLGMFDGVITKPADSQFLSQFLRPNLSDIIFMVANITPFLYILYLYPPQIDWAYLPLYIIMIILGNIIWLTFKTTLVTFNFWWQKLSNLSELIFSLIETGKYPVSIFPKNFRFIFYTIVPAAFAGMVPAEVLRGSASWQIVAGAFAMAIAMSAISRLVWKKAVKNYSSASS